MPGAYAALSYNLLYNKVYNGFVFDFYHKSGLKNDPSFESFSDFKSRCGEEFSEKSLFRSFIKKLFHKKYSIVSFEELNHAPDCYIRDGNNIFLLEFKDYFVADEIADKADYDLIKNEIDKKFIRNRDGKPKGIMQPANQVAFLESKCHQYKPYIHHSGY